MRLQQDSRIPRMPRFISCSGPCRPLNMLLCSSTGSVAALMRALHSLGCASLHYMPSYGTLLLLAKFVDTVGLALPAGWSLSAPSQSHPSSATGDPCDCNRHSGIIAILA